MTENAKDCTVYGIPKYTVMNVSVSESSNGIVFKI